MKLKWKFEKEEWFKRISSLLILLGAAIIFYIIQYYQFLWGDDVLFQYENSHYCYTGLNQWWPAERITNLSMMHNEVWARWLYFSGRLSTVFFVPLLNIWGQNICSIIGSIIYVLFIIFMARIIWGNWKECLLHPIGLLCIYLLQFHFSPTVSYMQMWTFVCHYSMPIVLCLLYYILWVECTKKQMSWRGLLAINLFGIYVGATHELLPLYCFILIGVRGLVLYKKKFFKPLLISNIGILLGYLVVVFAPGNLVRMGIAHDKRRMETGIKEKFAISWKSHVEALGLENLIVKVLLIVAIFIIVFSVYKKRKKVKEMILDNLEFVVAAVLSVVLWAIVAPPVAQYSLPFFKAVLLIFFFRIVNIESTFSLKYVGLVCATVVVFMLSNIGWCRDVVDVTIYRREQIRIAKEANLDEVVVINYPESTANYYTDFNVGNTPGMHDNVVDADFYGIRIITVED